MAFDTTAKIIITGEAQGLERAMQQARGYVTQGTRDMQAALLSVQNILGAVGALGFGAFARGAISSAAALNDMKVATGGAVEGLSKLVDIGRIGGHDMASIQEAIVGVNRALSNSEDAGKGATLALQALRIDLGRIKNMSADQQLMEIAKAFDRIEEGPRKVSMAMAIWKDRGADMLPILADLIQYQDRSASLTEKQAEEAEKLEKAWAALTTTISGTARSWIIDAISGWSRLIDLVKQYGVLTGSLKAFNPTGLESLDAPAVRARIEKLERDLETAKTDAEAEKIGRDLMLARNRLQEVMQAAGAFSGAKEPGVYIPRTVPTAGGGGGSGIDPALQAMTERMEMARHVAKLLEDDLKGATDEQARLAKAEADYAKNVQDLLGPSEQRAQQLEAEAAALGLTEQQIQAKALAELEAARATEILNGVSEQNLSILDREIDARRRILEASNTIDADKKAQEAAKKTAEEWQRASEDITNSLTDALLRGFESGKDWAQNFVDTLKNLFASLVLRPIIQPIASSVAGTLLGAVGMGTPGTAGAAGSGGAGGLNLLGSFGSAVSGGAGMAYLGSLIGGEFGAGLAFGSTGVSGALAGAGAFSAAGSAAGTAGATLGVIGAAMPYIGLALAAASALGLFEGDGPAQRTSRYMANLGQDWPHAYQNNQWFSSSMHGEMNSFTAARAAQEQQLIESMGLSAEQIAKVNEALALVAQKTYNFGEEFQPVPQATWDAIAADRLDAIAKALGKSAQEIADEMSGAAQTIREQAAAGFQAWMVEVSKWGAAAGAALMAQFKEYATAARDLGALRAQLSGGDLSPANPYDKLQQAKAMFEADAARAAAGDLVASQALQSSAPGLLEAARGYYASSSGYVSIYEQVQEALRQAQNKALSLGNLGDLIDETKTGNAANEAGLQQIVAQLTKIEQRLAAMEQNGTLATVAPPTAPNLRNVSLDLAAFGGSLP